MLNQHDGDDDDDDIGERENLGLDIIDFIITLKSHDDKNLSVTLSAEEQVCPYTLSIGSLKNKLEGTFAKCVM